MALPIPPATGATTVQKVVYYASLLNSGITIAEPLIGAIIGEIISLSQSLPIVTPENADQLNAEIKAAQGSIKMF